MVVADELLINVRANTAQAIAGLGAVEAKTKKLSAQLVTAGKKITQGFSLPVVAIGGLAMKAFADFDSAMTQSLAIMGDAAGEWRDEMETAAREVGKTTTFSAKEAAESYFFLASAGMNAQQSIAALPQVAAFAQAGMFDMARATDLATDAQSALGLTVKDPIKNLENLTRVTDVLVRANTLANASVEQFSSALTTKAAAAARLLGMEIEETTSILAVMADAGVKGNIAGTQLSMMLNNMTSNAVKNKDAWTDLGVEVFDGGGKMRKMSDIVADLTVGLGGMSDEQKVATIMNLGFGDRAAATVKVLLGTSDAMAGYEEAMRSASGFTQDVASKQLESFSARLGLVKSAIIDAGISLGEQLLPPVTNFVENALPRLGAGMGIVKDLFLSMPEWGQKAVIGIGLVTVALSALVAHPIVFGLTVIAGLLIEIGNNTRTLGDIADSFQGDLAITETAVEALVLTLSNRDGFDEFANLLGEAGTDVGAFAEAVLGGPESLALFVEGLTDAADAYEISTLELSLLKKLMEELAPEIRAVTDEVEALAIAERADTRQFRLGLEKTVVGVALLAEELEGIIPPLENFGDTTEEETYKARNLFAELPKAVEMSMEEVKNIFLANIEAQRNWFDNINTLIEMGLTNVASEFINAGPSFAPALDEMLAEPFRTTLKEMGIAAGDEAKTWGGMVGDAWIGNPPVLPPVDIDFVVGRLPALPKFTAAIDFVTKGGRAVYHGGVNTVPGAIGANVPALLQAGEGVLSVSENNARKRGEGGGGGGGGPLIGQLNVTNQADPIAVAREIGWELLRRGA